MGMMKFATSTLFVIVSIAIATNSYSNQSNSRIEVKNYETQGNLESKYTFGCVSAKELKNHYTPADLYKSFNDCVKKGNTKDGALIFALAGVYGRFDTLRVTDKSAHQAITVLKMQAFKDVSVQQQSTFKTALSQFFANPQNLDTACNQIKKIGQPTYYPAYMIQHGIRAFTKEDSSNNALVKDFNSKAAWNDSLENYLHCKKVIKPYANGLN